jgi:hypothetical protein
MIAFIRRILFTEPTGPTPGFRYVILTLLVLAIGYGIALLATQSHPGLDRYSAVLFMIALLLHHLTSQFRWRWHIFVTLRIFLCAIVLLFVLCFARASWSWIVH